MRILIGYCLFFLLLALMSCQTKEDTPPISPVPVIAFKGLTKHTSLPFGPQNNLVNDSVNLVIDYQDGDGDLGYTSEEVDNLVNQYGAGGVDDRRIYNYYLELEKKVNGVFRPVLYPTPGITFWGIFPRVELANAAYNYPNSPYPFRIRTFPPHRGEITYRFRIEAPIDQSPGYAQVGDTLRAHVQIADRALNVSNTIQTPEFIYAK
ncbi:MAG: hypothetical protein AVDCRST_MAG56-8203 [uncultured Cytophagales bacterium]|uniref:Uncharacterized protein n=1 Tax=uncultured Cytophagales bacterium TaxID=158755 RepID=A0A6J4M168_9SPHI|nr:MAG: hypothetical protein AVDCRST_MAG56-8203 [uncultured Cytophagales bacterium]